VLPPAGLSLTARAARAQGARDGGVPAAAPRDVVRALRRVPAGAAGAAAAAPATRTRHRSGGAGGAAHTPVGRRQGTPSSPSTASCVVHSARLRIASPARRLSARPSVVTLQHPQLRDVSPVRMHLGVYVGAMERLRERRRERSPKPFLSLPFGCTALYTCQLLFASPPSPRTTQWLLAAHPSLLERRPLRHAERRKLLHAGPASSAAASRARVDALAPALTPAPLLVAEPSFEGFTLAHLSTVRSRRSPSSQSFCGSAQSPGRALRHPRRTSGRRALSPNPL
jgi:hypothetical protein